MSSPEIEIAIAKAWEKIEVWYKKNAPSLLRFLNESASDEQLHELETRIEIPLPDDYKSSLKIHNGGIDIRSYNYLSTNEVLNTWLVRTEQSGQGTFEGREVFEQGGGVIQNTWWDHRWIPFAKDSGGNLVCIDMAPAVDGIEGQILYMEIASGPVASEYASFVEWLESYRDDLARGVYGFDAEAGEVLEKFEE